MNKKTVESGREFTGDLSSPALHASGSWIKFELVLTKVAVLELNTCL